MKKIFAVTVMFACVLGFAKASVDFMLSSPSAGLVTIGYSAQPNDNVLSLPLSISLSDQATFSLSSCIVFVYPDFIADPDASMLLSDPGGYVYPPGPEEQSYSQIDITFGAIEGGSMPTSVDNLVTLRIQGGGAGFSYVTLSENLLRGGIIDTSGNHVGATFPDPFYVTIPEPATVSLLALGGLALLGKRK